MISIYCGKVEDLLSNFRPDFFDACLCDPPYGLKFMGKSWDHGVPSAAIWKQVKRTLKPGAPILAFGGTRTYHRLAVAIEDAGFEIFDSILGAAWIYGQGFPKSLDIGKAIDKAAGAVRPVIGSKLGRPGMAKDGSNQRSGFDVCFHGDAGGRTMASDITAPVTEHARAWNGYGTALKPAWEPIVFARKPLDGTYAENCVEYGCGGLNIDGSRIAGPKPDTTRGAGGQHGRYSNLPAQGRIEDDGRGRYPANLILSHHPECENEGGCHPECPVAALDRQSGFSTDRPAKSTLAGRGSGSGTKKREHCYGKGLGGIATTGYTTSGGASRFFYCSKVSTRERNAGLPPDLRCDHPTLKPIDLCRYLAALILPPTRPSNQPRNLLIPFSGAGSEIIGATLAGWESIAAIEKESEYIEQAWYRIKARTGAKAIVFD